MTEQVKGRGLVEDAGSLGDPADGALQALSLFTRLKATRRTGWVDSGVADAESISDHMYRCAMTALALGAVDKSFDAGKLCRMMLAHDASESVVGDITPGDRVPRELKAQREDEAMRGVAQMAGGFGEELHSLWAEFEEGKTPEARVGQQIDKFEMILQAAEYERAQGKRLDRFFDGCRGMFVHPVLAKWAAQVEAQRPPLQH
eukprot:m51a1_g13720 hypothetical protein (203) ;mRNA; f:105531-106291